MYVIIFEERYDYYFVPIVTTLMAWIEFFWMDKIAAVLSGVLVYKILDAYYKRHCKVKTCDVEAGQICVCDELLTAKEIKEKYKRDIESHKLYVKQQQAAERKLLEREEQAEKEKIKQKEQYLKSIFKAEEANKLAAEKAKQANKKLEEKIKRDKAEAKLRAKRGLPPKLPAWRQPVRPKQPKGIIAKPPMRIYPKLILDKYARQFKCLTKKRSAEPMDVNEEVNETEEEMDEDVEEESQEDLEHI